MQNQEVKGEQCSRGACRISAGSRVGMLVLPWILIKSRQSRVEPVSDKVGADAAGLQITLLVVRKYVDRDSHMLCISLTHRGC